MRASLVLLLVPAFVSAQFLNLTECAGVPVCKMAGDACDGFLANVVQQGTGALPLPPARAECVCAANNTANLEACAKDRCAVAIPLLGVVKASCALYDANKDCRNSTACTTATASCDGILATLVTTGALPANLTTEQRACLCSNATRAAVSQCGNDKCAFASILAPALDEICIAAQCVTTPACQNATTLCGGFLGDYINGANDGSPTLGQLTCLCGDVFNATLSACAGVCPFAADVVGRLVDKCDVPSSVSTASVTASVTASASRTVVPVTTNTPSSARRVAGGLLAILILLI